MWAKARRAGVGFQLLSCKGKLSSKISAPRGGNLGKLTESSLGVFGVDRLQGQGLRSTTDSQTGAATGTVSNETGGSGSSLGSGPIVGCGAVLGTTKPLHLQLNGALRSNGSSFGQNGGA